METKKRAVLPDILRIILCAGVVIYHYTPERPSTGPLMVTGFLILSGFLLGLMFQRVKELECASFYRHKVQRFIPLMVVALLIAVVDKALTDIPLLPDWNKWKWINFSICDFLEYYNVPLWYMVTECSMLLAAPFFFFVSRARWGLECLGAVMLGITAVMFSQVESGTSFAHGLYFSPLARCWQFIAGLCAARWYVRLGMDTRPAGTGVKLLTGVLGAVFLSATVAFVILKQEADLNYWNYSLNFELLATLLYVLFIPGLFAIKCSVSERTGKWIAYAAVLTYPVYLIHVPVRHYAGYHLWWAGVVWYGIAGAVFSIIISHYLLKGDAWLQKRFPCSGK